MHIKAQLEIQNTKEFLTNIKPLFIKNQIKQTYK